MRTSFKSTLTYDSCSRTADGWSLKNAEIKKNDSYVVSSKDLTLSYKLSFKRLHLFLHVDIGEEAKIIVQKIPSFKGGQSKRVHFSLACKNAEVQLGEEKVVIDCLSNPFSDNKKVSIKQPLHENDAILTVNLSKQYENSIAELYFKCFDLQFFQHFKGLFQDSFFDRLEGRADGLAVFRYNKNLDHLFFNLSIEDFLSNNLSNDFFLSAKKLSFEGEYPILQEKASKWVPSHFLQKIRIDSKIIEGQVRTKKESLLSNISGKISFNPGLGPKWDINGSGHGNEKLFHFATTGKGFFHSFFENWLNGSISFSDTSSEVTFNLEEKKSFFAFEADLEKFNYHHFNCIQKFIELFTNKMPSFEVKKGVFSGKILAHYFEKGAIEVAFSDFFANDLAILDNKKTLSAKEIHLNGSYNLQSLSSLNGEIDIDKGAFSHFASNVTLEDVQGSFKFSSGSVHPSEVSFILCGAEGFSTIDGTIEDPQIETKISGSWDDFAPLLNESLQMALGYKSLTFSSNFTVKKNEISGDFQFFENESLQDAFSFALNLSDSLNRKKEFVPKIQNGWIKGSDISLSRIKYNSGISFNGKANFLAKLDAKKVSAVINAKDLVGDTNSLHFSIKNIGRSFGNELDTNSCINLDYLLEEKKINFNFPIERGSLTIKKYGVTFEEVEGVFSLVEDNITVQVANTQSEKIDFEGACSFHIEENALQVVTNKIRGKIDDLKIFLSRFPIDSLDLYQLKGEFESSENGFYLSTVLHDDSIPVDWKADLTFEDANYEISPQANLQKIQGALSYNTFTKEGGLRDLKARMLLDSEGEQEAFDLYIPYISLQENILFDVRLSKSFWDVVRLKGNINRKDNKLSIALDGEETHFWGTHLNIQELKLKDYQLQTLKMSPKIDLELFPDQIKIVNQIFSSTFPQIMIDEVLRNKLSGIVDCEIVFATDEMSHISLKGSNLVIAQNSFKNFIFKATGKDSSWKITEIILDDYKGSCEVKKDLDQWVVSNCSLLLSSFGKIDMNFYLNDAFQVNGELVQLQINADLFQNLIQKEMDIKGDIQGLGRFSIDLPYNSRKLQIETDIDLQTSELIIDEFALKNSGPMKMYFSLNDGLVVRGLNIHVFHPEEKFTWLECKIGRLYHKAKEKKWSYKDLQVFLPKQCFANLMRKNKWADSLKELGSFFDKNDDLDFSTRGDFDTQTKTLHMQINQYQISSNNNDFHLFKDIDLYICPGSVYGRTNYRYQNKYLPFQFSLDFSDKIEGRIVFEEKSDTPLTVLFGFDKALKIYSINGCFEGLDACFHKESDEKNAPFIGSLKLDLNRAKGLFPGLVGEFFEELNIGNGYELRGKLYLEPFHFEGTFSGKDCELAGCIFKTLLSSIQISSDAVTIDDFKISDRSGIYKLDKININKSKEEKWLFSIPLISFKEFRPSLLQKKNEPLGEIKPLVVRELSITDLHGDLEDKSTFKGKGFLSFINSFKREYTLFDIPADFLGRIFGLDMELLIPVRGIIDFSIHDGKIFVEELKDSFSEGKRSKFFLVDKKDSHTLDFDGNLNVHIQMKHFVLFKFTEPFILSIEGNLDKPAISLKTKKSFFSKK